MTDEDGSGHPGESADGGHPGGHAGWGDPSGRHPAGHPGGGHPGAGPASTAAARFSGHYEGTAPWDIGRPQPALVELAKGRTIPEGHLLDVGCGRGDNAMFFAERGWSVVGVDAVHTAIASARRKAADAGLANRTIFIEGDVLDYLPAAGGPFDAVTDCGFFHALDDPSRTEFATLLAEVLRPGGVYVALMFSDRVPGPFGPRRVSEAEVRATFTPPVFEVVEVRPAELHTAVPDRPIIDANLAVIRRA